MEPDQQRAATLVEQVKALEAAGGDDWRRTELMDELQDVVGLAGRMVTDADILKRAARLIAGG